MLKGVDVDVVSLKPDVMTRVTIIINFSSVGNALALDLALSFVSVGKYQTFLR